MITYENPVTGLINTVSEQEFNNLKKLLAECKITLIMISNEKV